VFQQYVYENFVPLPIMLVFLFWFLKCLFRKFLIAHKHQAIPYILNNRIGAGSADGGFVKCMNKPAKFHPKKMFLEGNLLKYSAVFYLLFFHHLRHLSPQNISD